MELAAQWASLPLEGAPTFDPDTDTLIRQSIVGQMLLCEMRHGYADTKGFLEPVNEKMCFGTMVHYIVEQDLLTGEEQAGLLMNMGDWVNRILVEDYDWSLDDVDDSVSFFSEIGVAYRTWRKTVRPKYKGEPLGVEQEIFLFLGEGNKGNIFMKGTPDVIFPSRIRDLKTAGRGWKKAKADVSIQASLYPALVKEYYGEGIQDFTFDVYDRSKSKWTSFPVHRRVKDINSALRQAYAMGLKVEAGLYSAHPVPEASFIKKRGWYCSPNYCGAWNVCEFKYLADDVNENQLAIRSWT